MYLIFFHAPGKSYLDMPFSQGHAEQKHIE